MPRGPNHQRLADYVDNANPDGLDVAAYQWRTGMELLRQVSKELQAKTEGMKSAESYGDSDIWTGQTASTARVAFAQSSQAMHDKADEMEKGSNAFTDAATGIRHARTKLHALDQADPGAKPTAPTYSPGPRSHADEVKQSHYDTSVATWNHDYHANEIAADTAITHLQDNHTQQAKVFQGIHGENREGPGGGGGGGGDPVNTGSRPTVSPPPNRGVDHGHIDAPHHDDTNTNPTDGGGDTHPGGGNTGPGGGRTNPGGGGIDIGPATGTGVPQGPTTTSPFGPLTSPGTPSGGGAGAVGGVGAVAGGAFGGAAAAGLAGGLAGGLNGGLSGLTPVGAGGRGNLSASGVRGIGATSRTGVGSVLGRGTGTGGRSGAGGMSTRNGGRGGGKGRSAAQRGSRGSAGSRGAGAGAGSGRNGKDKKRNGEDRDLFDDGQDWLDDEAQPGLLD